MKNRKFYTCCFTGHRPNKLPWKYNERGVVFEEIKLKLKSQILNMISKGYKYFISGMALGIDIICSELILELKNCGFKIILECAIPCNNQTERWQPEQIRRYENIIEKADKVTYVSRCKYYNGCMQKRNKYMVENSNSIIAVYNGECGGTQQTIEYAEKQNLDVIIIPV